MYPLGTAWAIIFYAEKMCILRNCFRLLGFSLGWSICVTFHIILTEAGQILECLRETVYRRALKYLQSLRSKNKEKKKVPTETRGAYFWPYGWPVVGGDMFSPLAPILGPV